MNARNSAAARVAPQLVLVMVMFALTGCRDPKPTVQVPAGPPEIKGRAVDSDGNPLARVALVFLPQDEANKGTRVTCVTKADGTFTGRCPPGRCKVTLSALSASAPKEDKPDKGKPAPRTPKLPPGVPARYGSATETPWDVDVPAGGQSEIVLKVESE